MTDQAEYARITEVMIALSGTKRPEVEKRYFALVGGLGVSEPEVIREMSAKVVRARLDRGWPADHDPQSRRIR